MLRNYYSTTVLVVILSVVFVVFSMIDTIALIIVISCFIIIAGNVSIFVVSISAIVNTMIMWLVFRVISIIVVVFPR